MKVIVGLGNPGRAYAGSRHNIGFTVLKALARRLKAELKKERSIPCLSAQAHIGAETVVLAMPLTYMNLSGEAVAGLARKYKFSAGELLVVCDDIDLELGRMKLRPEGSSGGQRGLKSVIDALGNQGFARLRIGVSRPPSGSRACDYVLSVFDGDEKRMASEIVRKAVDCCAAWVESGLEKTMNTFNKRSKNE